MTLGEYLDEARVKSGAKKYVGHDIMDLMRFDEDTRHMIIYDIKEDCNVLGFQGDRVRVFINDEQYEYIKSMERLGSIKIINHARVRNGYLFYDDKQKGL